MNALCGTKRRDREQRGPESGLPARRGRFWGIFGRGLDAQRRPGIEGKGDGRVANTRRPKSGQFPRFIQIYVSFQVTSLVRYLLLVGDVGNDCQKENRGDG